jgi:hypothetical protein
MKPTISRGYICTKARNRKRDSAARNLTQGGNFLRSQQYGAYYEPTHLRDRYWDI